jgi:hypothetical protein
MKMEAQRYTLNYSILSLPFRKDQRILITLRFGDYQRSFLLDESLKRGSITIMESAVIIAFTKQVKERIQASLRPQCRGLHQLRTRLAVKSTAPGPVAGAEGRICPRGLGA